MNNGRQSAWMKGFLDNNRLFLLVLLAVDFIWVKSSVGKIIGGTFVNSLGIVLTKFASQNPYLWYKNFLLSTIIPNSSFFGILIMLGEVFAAFSLLLGIGFLLFKPINKIISLLLIAGFITGVFLNLNFWLASAWVSPSTESLNLLMFLIQLLGLIYIIRFYRSKTPTVS